MNRNISKINIDPAYSYEKDRYYPNVKCLKLTCIIGNKQMAIELLKQKQTPSDADILLDNINTWDEEMKRRRKELDERTK